MKIDEGKPVARTGSFGYLLLALVFVVIFVLIVLKGNGVPLP